MTSHWIPLRRIRIAAAIAVAFATAAIIGAIWTLFALALLLPAVGAAIAAGIMLGVRRQLSQGGWQRRIHELVLERLPPAATVLDIGCGDASLLALLLQRSPEAAATGVDFWGDDWDYAQAACERRIADLGRRAVFRRMDAARLEFPDASFDAVVSVMCFHEVRSPAGDPRRGPLVAVAEALRVLKPGGAFVLIDRFADVSEYGDPAGLEAALATAEGLRREPLVATMGVPWPLNSKRALGPVQMLTGRKRAAMAAEAA